LITFISFLCLSCREGTETTYRVGDLIKVEQPGEYPDYKWWDVSRFRTVDTLSEFLYDSEERAYLLQYNFKNQQIELVEKESSSIPVWLSTNDPERCKVSIAIGKEQVHSIEGKDPFTEAAIDKWMHAHILNYGLDPSLADSPAKAVFSLEFEKGQAITDADQVIYQLVKTYEKFILERASIDKINAEEAKEKYPLNLFIELKRTD
jgi:hypothetical protein